MRTLPVKINENGGVQILPSKAYRMLHVLDERGKEIGPQMFVVSCINMDLVLYG